MRSKSKAAFFATSAALLALLLGVAFLALRARQRTEADLASLTARTAALRAELRQAERTRAEAERKRAALTAAAARSSETAAAAKPAAPPRRLAKPPGLAEMSRRNPDLWNAFIASQVAQTGKTYGPLFQSLKLREDQVDKFKALMAASGARGADLAAAADAQGLTREDPAIDALWQRSAQQLAADQTALLGEEGYRRLKDYERTLPARGLAHGLATALAFTDPLSPRQADQLTDAIAQTSPAYVAGGMPDLRSVDWAAIDRQAQLFLTPAQYTVWLRGDAYDSSIGSRSSQQLQALYKQALQQDKAAASSAPKN